MEIIFLLLGLVVGFGLGYLRFADPLQRKITALEKAKSRLELANEGVKAENQQLQSQLLQIDATNQRRRQELEQSYQSQINALQAQSSSQTQAIVQDTRLIDQSHETVQALTAQHQAEITAYQQRIHELETSLSANRSFPPSASSFPESPPSSPSNVSSTVAGVVTGVAGAAAGIAAGIGISDFFANQSEQKESNAELEEIPDNFVAETAQAENPFESINTFPENLTETVADSKPEAIAAESSFDRVEVESESPFSDFSELNITDNPEDFSAVQIPVEEFALPAEAFSDQADEPQAQETTSADFIRFDPDSVLTDEPEVEELIEDPDSDPLVAAFWNEPSLTSEEIAVENSPSVAELLPQEAETIFSPADDIELFNGHETPEIEAELPNILSETETDSFASLFETDGESNDLAFLELLQANDEPFSLGEDPFSNDSGEAWNIEELLLTDHETLILDNHLTANGQHDDGFDELFDSLFSSEEKEPN